jgi:hypothetical protein
VLGRTGSCAKPSGLHFAIQTLKIGRFSKFLFRYRSKIRVSKTIVSAVTSLLSGCDQYVPYRFATILPTAGSHYEKP